jgi:hypothetical protein
MLGGTGTYLSMIWRTEKRSEEMQSKRFQVDWKSTLCGVGGFTIGAAIGSSVNYVIAKTLVCAIFYSIGYAVIGAIGGFALGLVRRGTQDVLLQSLAGGLGFGIGHSIGRPIASAINGWIGDSMGHYIITSPGYIFENALLNFIMLSITFFIGGAALGMAFRGDKVTRFRLLVAGVLGITFGLTLVGLLGLTTSDSLMAMIAIIIGGGGLGAMVGKTFELPRPLLLGIIGLSGGYLLGGVIGLFVGFEIRPDIVGAIVGAAVALIYTLKIRKPLETN